MTRAAARKAETAELKRTSFISILEAMSWLAFGVARTAEVERARHGQEIAKLQALIDRCLDEAANDEVYCGYPSHLPYDPLVSLIEWLEEAPQPHPPTSASLLRTANQVARKRDKREAQYEEALIRIREAARAGDLELWGRRSLGVATRAEIIPLPFLLGEITIDTSLQHLAHAPCRGNPTRQRAIIAPRGKFSDCYYKVELDRRKFQTHFKLTVGAHGRQEPRQPTYDEIRRWFVGDYLPLVKGSNTLPSVKADVEAAQQRFPGMIKVREEIRRLRRDVRPDYIRPRGRPRKMRAE